jgi:hypothetical protein
VLKSDPKAVRLKRKRELLVTLRYRAAIWRVYIVEGFWFLVQITLLTIFAVWFGGIVHGIVSPPIRAVFCDLGGLTQIDSPRCPASR